MEAVDSVNACFGAPTACPDPLARSAGAIPPRLRGHRLPRPVAAAAPAHPPRDTPVFPAHPLPARNLRSRPLQEPR